MSDKKKILIQLDSDPIPSVFDRIVAVDAGADEVFSYGGIAPEMVRELIYGAIFTRGTKDLNHTAVFIGGNDLARGEEMLGRAVKSFIGSLRVSVMLDSNGANTTAAAAVASAGRHQELKGAAVLVLGGTGPVGKRVVRLCATEGAAVRLGSRNLEKARTACEEMRAKVAGGAGSISPAATQSEAELSRALEGVQVVISAGGAGALLLPKKARERFRQIKVMADLNAVPPLGIEGVDAMDKAADRDGVVAYGAIGVGGLKMKIHKQAVAALFERNDQVFDVEEIFKLGRALPA